jgi:hypothetical protein
LDLFIYLENYFEIWGVGFMLIKSGYLGLLIKGYKMKPYHLKEWEI